MTQTFWIAATVLTVIALSFELYPVNFHRSGARRQADLRNQNLMAYRSRMKELDNEHQAGILDDENYQQLREELAGTMLDDVPETETPARVVTGRKSAIVVALVSILLVPAATVYLYQRWGAMDQVESFLAMQEMDATDTARRARMSELTDQLRSKLEQDPDNTEGWAMLGRTYMRLERYDDAAWAFRQLADSVSGEREARATARGLAAQALFFRSEGAMTEGVNKAIGSVFWRWRPIIPRPAPFGVVSGKHTTVWVRRRPPSSPKKPWLGRACLSGCRWTRRSVIRFPRIPPCSCSHAGPAPVTGRHWPWPVSARGTCPWRYIWMTGTRCRPRPGFPVPAVSW